MIFIFVMPLIADKFSFTFKWGNIPLCTSGYPNIVKNPIFKLSNVPNGTKRIAFILKDLDVPDYVHGGGEIIYKGDNIIKSGFFTYKSPCPPNGVHHYLWIAIAKGDNNKTIAIAKSMQKYPPQKE